MSKTIHASDSILMTEEFGHLLFEHLFLSFLPSHSSLFACLQINSGENLFIQVPSICLVLLFINEIRNNTIEHSKLSRRFGHARFP